MDNKVIINGKFLSQRLTGVQRVAFELVHYLDQECKGSNNFELAFFKNSLGYKLSNIPQKKVGFLKGNLWEQISLPLYAGNKKILNLGNVAPLLSQNCYSFIHDISFHVNRNFFSKSFVTWYEFAIPRVLKNSKHIFVNSQFTKDEICNCYGDYSGKITVLYLGHEHIPANSANSNSAETLNRFKLEKNQYLFAVSSKSPNKNFSRLCKAVEFLRKEGEDIPLVIAGGNSTIFKNESLRAYDDVIATGYVTDEELVHLYEGAKLFAFPSIYEGFGLPPLEALKLNTPSVVSLTSAFPEIYGDSVIYCDPFDITDIAEKILKLWKSDKLRSKLISKKNNLLKKYSWPKSAQKMLGKIQSFEV